MKTFTVYVEELQFQSPIWWGCELDTKTIVSWKPELSAFQSPIWWGCELDYHRSFSFTKTSPGFNPRFGGVVSWINKTAPLPVLRS